MKFAIWAAVSSKPQAEDDKESLAEQEKRSRALGLSRAWVESAGPYIVPGQSRSRWVNLRDAEDEIPPLRQLLEDAKAGRFDILILYDYNRLRDLLDPVAKTLASYGVQVYSINQPVEPLPVEDFSPWASDSESMMRGMSQVISRWQQADLRRKFQFGVSGRVEKGLYSIRIPYGYAKPPGREQDNKAVPVQVPSKVRAIAEMKSLFLRGVPYYEITRQLQSQGHPTPEDANSWSHSTVKKIMANPFYAGKVFFRMRRVVRDPRNKTVRLVRNPSPLIRDGLHQPVYSWEDYQSILAEFERRKRLPHNNRYAFSGLLSCSACGARLVHERTYWRCRKGHVALTDLEAFAVIPRHIQRKLRIIPSSEPASPPPSDPAPILRDLDRQRRRIQQAYESDVYSIAEAEEKIKNINAQIEAVKNEETSRLRKRADRQRFLETVEGIQSDLDRLPEWIRSDDPRQVNLLLHRLFREIVVSPSLEVTVRFMDE